MTINRMVLNNIGPARAASIFGCPHSGTALADQELNVSTKSVLHREEASIVVELSLLPLRTKRTNYFVPSARARACVGWGGARGGRGAGEIWLHIKLRVPKSALDASWDTHPITNAKSFSGFRFASSCIRNKVGAASFN